MTGDVPLFDGYEPPPSEDLSADQRRTRRQHQQVQAGVHPLTGGPLHPLASRHRDPASPKQDPFTCGSCWYRVLSPHGYPKCTAGDGQRVTAGAATDVRAWWPACPAYSPAARDVSPDAARGLPEP